MIRRKTTLKAKSGGVQTGNGAGHPRALIDEAQYRERRNAFVVKHDGGAGNPYWDARFSGWTHASRPRDYAVFIRTPSQPG